MRQCLIHDEYLPFAIVMALGGNGPTIVRDDADPIAAARAIAPTCFYAAGQMCVSAERILVSNNLKDVFVEEMTIQSRNWTLADPWDKPLNRISRRLRFIPAELALILPLPVGWERKR